MNRPSSMKSIRFEREHEIVPAARNVYINEPPVSKTSVEYNYVDEDEESVEKTQYYDSKYMRQIHRYEVSRIIQGLLIGDVPSTVTQLILLSDMEVDKKAFQAVFEERGGFDLLINILEVNNSQCILATLKCLEKITTTNRIRLLCTDLGIMPLLIKHLQSDDVVVKVAAARALSQLCQLHKPARYLRKYKGIRFVLNCMDAPKEVLFTPFDVLTEYQKNLVRLATAATAVLKESAKYPKGFHRLYKAGAVLLLKNITKCCHRDLLLEAFQLLTFCAAFDGFRRAIEDEGMIINVLQGIQPEDEAMTTACAATIATCAAKSPVTRHLVRFLDGLHIFVKLIKDLRRPQETISALVRAIAKLGQDNRNIKILSARGVLTNLVRILKKEWQLNSIICYVIEGIAQCCRLADNAQAFVNQECIPVLARKMYEIDPSILTAAAQCLGACAMHPKVAEKLFEHDVARLLFSILKKNDSRVTSTALWALRPLLRNAKGSAEEIRLLVGGFELVIKLLQSPDIAVASNACALLGEVAKDHENLYILSDCGVVAAIAECSLNESEQLRLNVADAVADTSTLRRNSAEYGLLGVVVVLKRYLHSHDVKLHIATMRALDALTKLSYNCIILHECGGVELILRDVAAPYRPLQELASSVLRNMREVCREVMNKVIRECHPLVVGKLGTKQERKHALRAEYIKRMEKAQFEVYKKEIEAGHTAFGKSERKHSDDDEDATIGYSR